MWQQIFMGFVGLCSGVVIAGGVVGLMIGLSIVPRYAGITHTADQILLYENMTLVGIFSGNLMYLFHIPFPAGSLFLPFLRQPAVPFLSLLPPYGFPYSLQNALQHHFRWY